MSQVKCKHCGEKFSSRGINRHIEAKHPDKTPMSQEEKKDSASIAEQALTSTEGEDVSMDNENPGNTQNMDARRQAAGNLDQVRLQNKLAKTRCPHCGQTGCWKVYKTEKEVRYIRCNGCQRSHQVWVERRALQVKAKAIPNDAEEVAAA